MKKIVIKNLFNQFNYEINLNSDGLSILTGPNGYGKSTILKMINALKRGIPGLFFLNNVKFSNFVIETDYKKIEIIKDENDISINGKRIKSFEREYRNYLRRQRTYYMLDDETILDRNTGMEFPVSEYFKKMVSGEIPVNDEMFSNLDLDGKSLKEVDTLLREISHSIGNIYFLEEQRLIKKNEIGRRKYGGTDNIIDIIEKLPSKMKDIFSSYIQKYSVNAAGLDSSYPTRLFTLEDELSFEDFQKEKQFFNENYQKMSNYRLATIPFLDSQYKKEVAKALKIYFDDFRKKFEIYKPFIEKLDLFARIINSRLRFKRVSLAPEFGIQISKDDGEIIDLSALSSGEKQEIVMFYDLIFEAESNSLFLIDEPEISLHVGWQTMFINDLFDVLHSNHSTAIIATHSPQIIGNHWDIITDLGEQYELNTTTSD